MKWSVSRLRVKFKAGPPNQERGFKLGPLSTDGGRGFTPVATALSNMPE